MARSYTIPSTLLDDVDALPLNRTAALRAAINKAYADPARLVTALVNRLSGPKAPEARSCRVTVSFTDDTLQKLSDLTSKSQLPTEHVLRLAIEEFLRNR